jgi:hypothetical protein
MVTSNGTNGLVLQSSILSLTDFPLSTDCKEMEQVLENTGAHSFSFSSIFFFF